MHSPALTAPGQGVEARISTDIKLRKIGRAPSPIVIEIRETSASEAPLRHTEGRKGLTLTTMNFGIAAALGSAVLFGASTPLAKLLVGTINPWLLAGLLYFASGIGLSAIRLLIPGRGSPMGKADWPWLAAAILCGGVAGPLLLMWGLTLTSAGTASLLLNAEGLFTALLAWFLFKENVDRRIAAGLAFIVVGTLVLSWPDELAFRAMWGPAAVVGACFCWAVDNNLTRKVSLSDPLQIASLKGLAAGAVNIGLALAIHSPLPPLPSVLSAAVVGFFGYGISLTLFVVGLRHLGTARAAAYFSAAPFVGALLAIPLTGEAVTGRLVVAAGLMGLGILLHLTERHDHGHVHEAVEHDHAHRHDEHHDHHHDGGAEPEHSHWHRHAPVMHQHPHYPDAHHRHAH